MDETYKKELSDIGVDVDNNMIRFMDNEVLFEKLLTMFLDDTSYGDMKAGLNENDCSKAFKGAHSLKGVAANLGLSSILERLVPAVEILRTGSMDIPENDLRTLDDNYMKICSVIKKHSEV